jgi:glutamine amidotransferase
MGKIGIIDYGMGNLHSVKNACDYLGIENFIATEQETLEKADGYILPGVGAFPDAMAALRKRALASFIQTEVKEKPLLGICLGMQLLFEKGYEGKETAGLGLIGGEVIRLSAYTQDKQYKIPHMGWNKLEIRKAGNPLLQGLDKEIFVYFVHSYKGVVAERSNLVAAAEYGEEVAGIVSKGNVYGTQFHPEKSEETGLMMLKNFGALL